MIPRIFIGQFKRCEQTILNPVSDAEIAPIGQSNPTNRQPSPISEEDFRSIVVTIPATWKVDAVLIDRDEMDTVFQPVFFDVAASFGFELLELSYQMTSSSFLITFKFKTTKLEDFDELFSKIRINVKSAVLLNLDFVGLFESLDPDNVGVAFDEKGKGYFSAGNPTENHRFFFSKSFSTKIG